MLAINKCIGCALIFLLVVSCASKKPTQKEEVYTVTKQDLSSSLFYTGIIKPLKTIVVPSPVDGAIIEAPFQYGNEVTKGQLLFKISSSKFITDYKAALLQYVKAKSEFNNNQMQLSEAQFLHKNQLISSDEFKVKKTNYYSAQLALVQAKDALESLIHQLDAPKINFYQLTIADIDKITHALHLEKNYENLQIFAPEAGVILAANKSDDEIKKINKGDSVKQGDVLAVIGDLNGFTVRIKVNELTVNQLQRGQKVKISGIAFHDLLLTGTIARIDHQGESSSGGLPNFSVDIIVPNLTAKQRATIHIGMSAKVEINLQESTQLSIPIAALIEKKGKLYVNRYDEKNKIKKLVEVIPGKTTDTTVAILSGINEGEKIVYAN